ncbi:peptidase [Aeromicrobium flavum]|uniref:Peptidase n=1 Tax=Aeromicrobium flavum TaxID=416568 RepID=A0A512HTF3_9ACTN|nr:peptidase [Aeromicrobium flavum]
MRPVETDQDATVTISAVVPDAMSQTYAVGRRAKRPTPVAGTRRAAAVAATVPRVAPAVSLPEPPAADDTITFPAVGALPEGRIPGTRRAARRAAAASSRTRLLAGAAAVAIAAVGSLSVTSPGLLAGADAALAKSYVGANATNAVDVSRNYDRELAVQKPLQAQQIAKANAEKKVQARQNEIIRNQWVIPVVGYRITARFGQGGGYWSSGRHTGLDFAGPSGSTLVAVAAGTVTSTGYEGAYGNRTIITLDDGTEIWYCHQSAIQVEVGKKVAPGDVIGATGSTGNVTGPHLHFEVHPGGGAAVDPAAVLQSHGVNP